MRHTLLGTVLLVGLLSACAASRDPASDETVQAVPSVSNGIELSAKPNEGTPTAPTPIVTLKLTNGNQLEFYDFGSGALISEVGDAYVKPLYDAEGKTVFQLVDTWQQLAPAGAAVPPELVAMQERLTTPQASRKNVGNVTVMRSSESANTSKGASKKGSVGGGNDLVSTLAWCGNGCCDSAWLTSNVSACTSHGWDQSWFLFEYGYSYANWNDVIFARTAACAAWGTSTFSINIGGSGGTWSVLQGNLRTFNWDAAYDWFFCAGWCGENMTSNVNTVNTQATHTYCGEILFD